MATTDNCTATAGWCCSASSKSDLSLLPDENAFHVLQYLDAASLKCCRETNSQWKRLTEDSRLWNALCLADFRCEGSQQDYAFHWRLARQKSLNNLQFFVQFFDEIYLSASAAFGLASVFVVFPLLAVLQADQYIQIGWNRVLCALHVLVFPVLFYGFVKCALLASCMVSNSPLRSCVDQLGVASVVRGVLWNRTTVLRLLILLAPVAVVEAFPLSVLLYVHGNIASKWMVFGMFWLSWSVLAIAATRIRRSMRQKALATLGCVLCTSGLLCLRVQFGFELSWTRIFLPNALLYVWEMNDSLQILSKSARKMFREDEIISYFHVRKALHDLHRCSYQTGFPPLVTLLMLFLRLNGSLKLPFVVIALDYFVWVFNGPVACVAKTIYWLLFREITTNTHHHHHPFQQPF